MTASATRRVVNILDRPVGQFAYTMPDALPTDAEGLQALLNAVQADINLIQARRAAGETLTGADRDRLRTAVADYRAIDAAHSVAIEAEAAGRPVDDAEIDALLAEAGTDKRALVSIQIVLTEISDAPAMNRAWDAWLDPAHKPARMTIQAPLVDPAWKVEITGVALAPR